jgi:Kef-type K+ transport system membrane component KefB
MDSLFWIGTLLIVGYIAGLISEKFNSPRVTGYIIAGTLLSPSITGAIPSQFLEDSRVIIDFALSIVAFLIGGSIRLELIREYGKRILSIVLFASEITLIVVAFGLALLLPILSDFSDWKEILAISLLLGAIGVATDPAAVLSVIKQYKAKGSTTSILMGVIAIDDAIALFNFSFVVAVVLIINGINGSFLHATVEPILSILFSIGIGLFAGYIQSLNLDRFYSRSGGVISTLGTLLIIHSIGTHLKIDELLICMSYGIALSNFAKNANRIFNEIENHFLEVIFVLFFIISGAKIDFNMIGDVWLLAIMYVVLRIIGKVVGSYIGERISKKSGEINEKIGFALMPQAGLAIGFALVINHSSSYSAYGDIILNSVIIAVVINEIIGSYMVKKILKESGEIK